MVSVPVQCPYCQSTAAIKAGKQANGTQRYQCHNDRCERRIVLLRYHNTGWEPAVKQQMVETALNGSGIRDTLVCSESARRLGSPPAKKAPALHPVSPALMIAGQGLLSAVVIRKGKEAELDEMWSFVGRKKQSRWLWQALDHQTGREVAYVFGRWEDQALLHLKALLTPLGIRRCCTDGWDAYRRHLDPHTGM
jgi:insertion element IS1 protein InsB